MTAQYQYHIEGQLRSDQDVSFAEVDLAICALVRGKEVASASVGKDGKYSLDFEGGPTPSAVELRLVPVIFRQRADRSSGLVQNIDPRVFVLDRPHGTGYRAIVNFPVPKQFILNLQWVTKTYHLNGDVYSWWLVPQLPPQPPSIVLTRLPNMQIDFYEVNRVIMWPQGNPPPMTERYLGSAYTDQFGHYDFKFQFTTNIITLVLFGDGKPDIKVRISQFFDGAWKQVFESMTDWDIAESFTKDYKIPLTDVHPVSPGYVKPSTGFQYNELGLLPIDPIGAPNSRIVKGYGTSREHDPVAISHQPFCGVLRIHGFFAAVDNVQYYIVQVAPADENGPTGEWTDVIDSLYNNQKNQATGGWEPVWLGPTRVPDPVTPGKYCYVYRNIDIDDERNWLEHALKVAWNTADPKLYPDGYYALRIVPCHDDKGNYDRDVHGNPKVAYPMPVLRVDNSIPEAVLQVDWERVPQDNAKDKDCGLLKLGTDRNIPFKVKAYSPAGHILWYDLSATRGVQGSSAGNVIKKERGFDNPNWDLGPDQSETFSVATTNGCKAGMAYHFLLRVQGSATNGYYGYYTESEYQRAYSNVNLVVSE